MRMVLADRGREGLEVSLLIENGRPGKISFSRGFLTADTLPAYANELHAVGVAVSRGDLHLWSCQTAYGESGERFVQTLAHFTEASVCGSEEVVGSADRGGSWTLKAKARPPLTSEAIGDYRGIMDTSNGTTVDN